MNFAELQEKIGAQNKKDWHQHKNGGGWVHKNAIVVAELFIGEQAIVFGGTFKGGTFKGGWFEGGTFEGGTFEEKDRIWKSSPLFIIGSRYSLSNCKRGHIQIGCRCYTFSEWERHGLKIAKAEGFTSAEIEEYRAYVKLFKKIGK